MRQSASTPQNFTVDPALDLVFGRHLLAHAFGCAPLPQLDADAAVDGRGLPEGRHEGWRRDRASAFRACFEEAGHCRNCSGVADEQAQARSIRSEGRVFAIKSRDDAEQHMHHVTSAWGHTRDHDALHASVWTWSRRRATCPIALNARGCSRLGGRLAFEARLKALKASRTLDQDRRELDE